MSPAALFVKAKRQKQPNYPSVGEWLNELWYMHTYGTIYTTEKGIGCSLKEQFLVKHGNLNHANMTEDIRYFFSGSYGDEEQFIACQVLRTAGPGVKMGIVIKAQQQGFLQ